MELTQRKKIFLDVLQRGLEERQQMRLQDTLGNRSAYLGISDMAKYQECPRASIAAKIVQKSNALASLLTLERGHWFEEGIAECLSSLGLKQMRQMEINYQYLDVPIKAHLDIVLVWEKPYPAVRILEIKSMENLPQAPYSSHIWQVQAQTEMLKSSWNTPVFTEAGCRKMTFPRLC